MGRSLQKKTLYICNLGNKYSFFFFHRSWLFLKVQVAPNVVISMLPKATIATQSINNLLVSNR